MPVKRTKRFFAAALAVCLLLATVFSGGVPGAFALETAAAQTVEEPPADSADSAPADQTPAVQPAADETVSPAASSATAENTAISSADSDDAENAAAVQAAANDVSALIDADIALLNWKANGTTATVTLNGTTYTVTDEASYQTAYAAVCAALKEQATSVTTTIAAQTISQDTIWNISGEVTMTGSVTVAASARLVILGDGTIFANDDSQFINKGTLFLQDNVYLNGQGTQRTAYAVYSTAGSLYIADNFHVGNYPATYGIYAAASKVYMVGGLIGTKNISFTWKDENDNDLGTKNYDETLQYINENISGSRYDYISGIVATDGCLDGVAITSSAQFYMSGGIVAGNGSLTNSTGTGLRLSGKSVVTGGMVFGNRSTWGGGLNGGQDVQLLGGSVLGNYTSGYGGGIGAGSKLLLGGNFVLAYNACLVNGGGVVVNNGAWTIVQDSVLVTHNTAIGSTVTGYTGSGNGGAFRVVGTLEISGGTVSYNYANGKIETNLEDLNTGNGGAISAQTDSASRVADIKLTGGVLAHNKARESGGAIWSACMMEDLNITFALNGTAIRDNVAGKQGGGVYLAARRGSMEADVLAGELSGNEAGENGGGMYLELGDRSGIQGESFTVHIGSTEKSSDALKIFDNTAQKVGGAFYVGRSENNTAAENTINVDFYNGMLSNNIAVSGGGIAVVKGNLNIYGGTAAQNTAVNGGGAYVADGKVRMFGGALSGNIASHDGGGLYVSTGSTAADVVVRSGSITGNTAGGSGGGIAAVSANGTAADVITLGLLEPHPGAAQSPTRAFAAFDYTDAADGQPHNHASCPVLSGNTASRDGGGIYMGSSAARLNIYCLLESGNTAQGDRNGDAAMTVGGIVTIGDAKNNDEKARGNVVISSPLLVAGGEVDIWGNMQNPLFQNGILVDIQGTAGKFEDHRTHPADGEKDYKVHYFENFTAGGTQPASGLYSALQYDDEADVPALGTLFSHEGWRIVGWDTKADGTGTRYTIGSNIGGKNNHDAWGTDDTKPLILYAIWQRTAYTVVFWPNADGYSGKMADQRFEYDVSQPLTANAYRVQYQRFTGWNTKPDGTGTAYADGYADSRMSKQNDDTVNLYAQWVPCTHLMGDHPGTVTYTVSGSTITETCDCGYTASVTLSAADVYYDGAAHPARLRYTGTLLAAAPTIVYRVQAADGSYGALPTGEAVPTSAGSYRASITVGGQTVTVDYQIKSPTAGTSMEAKIAAGQFFRDFNGGTSASAAQNDAFTVRFTVQKLNLDVYQQAPVLSFGAALPAGTTIIMQTGGGYWYYRAAEGAGAAVPLSAFTAMGGTQSFAYTAAANQTYRFIVSFAQAQQTPGTQSITLTYTPTGATGQLQGAAALTRTAAVPFGLTAAGGTLTVTAPSAAEETSRWYGCGQLLVLEAPAALPADAQLTVTAGGKTTVHTRNARGQFVVPLAWAQQQSLSLALTTQQAAAAGRDYALSAVLYTAAGGQRLLATGCTADLSLAVPQLTAPALKISGGQRLLTVGQPLSVTLATQNTDGCTVSATVQVRGAGGSYSGNFLTAENLAAGEQSFSLAAITQPGSYRLLVTVTKGGRQVLAVPYYFIVQ